MILPLNLTVPGDLVLVLDLGEDLNLLAHDNGHLVLLDLVQSLVDIDLVLASSCLTILWQKKMAVLDFKVTSLNFGSLNTFWMV